MAGAPLGNQNWKARSKHGRDKIFKTPDLMWDAALEYFSYVDSTPFTEVKPMVVSNGAGAGSSIEMVEIPRKRPYTLIALCHFLDVNAVYFNQFESELEGKEDELSINFSKIVKKIREVIYNQKFEGAASGFFKENLIAKDLGMIAKTEVKNENPTQIIIERVIKNDADKP